MHLQINCKEPGTDAYYMNLELKKNNKGYHVKVKDKFYFPDPESPVLKNLDRLKNEKLHVAIVSDHVSYGRIAFVKPEYFARQIDNKVVIEKEIPLNYLDRIENIYEWAYEVIVEMQEPHKHKDPDDDITDRFITACESHGVPDEVVKEALNLWYGMIKN